MTILDQGMNLAGEKIDAGQQADRAVTLVFMITAEGRVHAGFGRQVRGRRCDRLDAEETIATASLGSIFDWAALSFRIFTWR